MVVVTRCQQGMSLVVGDILHFYHFDDNTFLFDTYILIHIR